MPDHVAKLGPAQTDRQQRELVCYSSGLAMQLVRDQQENTRGLKPESERAKQLRVVGSEASGLSGTAAAGRLLLEALFHEDSPPPTAGSSVPCDGDIWLGSFEVRQKSHVSSVSWSFSQGFQERREQEFLNGDVLTGIRLSFLVVGGQRIPTTPVIPAFYYAHRRRGWLGFMEGLVFKSYYLLNTQSLFGGEGRRSLLRKGLLLHWLKGSQGKAVPALTRNRCRIGGEGGLTPKTKRKKPANPSNSMKKPTRELTILPPCEY